jgi:murein DD-endopeptidase MepM/ murein hydrolase activator NlpD
MITKFIFSPVTPLYIGQKFGANEACISLKDGKVIACDGYNPPTGYKSVYSQMKGHSGIDLYATSWQPCYASQSGIVKEVVSEEARGLGVGIITKDKYYCTETGKDEYFKIRYWHFWANNVIENQEVKVGDLIGYCGSSGYSSGVHLHLEAKPVKVTFNKDGTIKRYSNILDGNGFYGAVDPLPYMEKISALQFAGLWKQVKELVARVGEFVADRMR